MLKFQSAGHSTRLIEDVVPPDVSLSINPHNDKVRKRSIGFLDAKYWQLRQSDKGQKAVDIVTATPREHTRTYTRIPPLRTFAAAPSEVQSIHLPESFASHVQALGAGITSAGILIGHRLRALPWLPKKYTMSRGLRNDLSTWPFKQARWSLPILLLSGGLLLASLPWSGGVIPGTVPPTGRPRSGQTVEAQLVNAKQAQALQSSNAGISKTTSSNTPTTRTAPASTLPRTQAVLSPTSPVPVIGGMGAEAPAPVIPSPEVPATPPTDPIPNDDPLTNVIQMVTQPLAPVTTIPDPSL